MGSVGSYKDPKFLHADSDDWADAQTYLSLHWVNRSFCWICHAAAHSSFTMERNLQVNCKVCPQYISYCKIPKFFYDFRHILSYKRALRVTIALKL